MDSFLFPDKKRRRARTTPASKENLDLWARSSAQKNSGDIERLKPLAVELARKAGHFGITIADVRIVAVQRGLIPEKASGRELSYLGSLMKAAGLQPTGEFRRSIVEGSHGNIHKVFRTPVERQSA